MAYVSFKSPQEVAKKYQISLEVKAFVTPQFQEVDARFREDLAYVLQAIDVRMSEAAICEFLIAPMLKEAWKPFAGSLLLWSHVALTVGGEFDGYPDYLLTKRTPLGLVRDKPYVLIVEAKKDDFEGGWGQCLAALVAAQQLNGDPNLKLQGIVSNGEIWQFGQLDDSHFIRDPRSFTLTDLEELMSALHSVFEIAKRESASYKI